MAIWIAQVDPLRPPVLAAWNRVEFSSQVWFFDLFMQSFETIQKHVMFVFLQDTYSLYKMVFHVVVVFVTFFSLSFFSACET